MASKKDFWVDMTGVVVERNDLLGVEEVIDVVAVRKVGVKDEAGQRLLYPAAPRTAIFLRACAIESGWNSGVLEPGSITFS